MKSLATYILESEIQPAVTVFYRANIGKNNDKELFGNNYSDKIGDITEISFKYAYNNELTFGKPTQGGRNWAFALQMDIKDNNSLNNFKKYLADKNKNDEFYQYFIDEKDAIKAADKAKKAYENKKWTLKTLLSAIKKDSNLMSLKYDYHITKTSSQVDNLPVESIYVSGSWRITIVDNKIHVKRAGWSTYEVPNLASLYKVLSADSGSDKDETIRQQYSIVV
jgi:hypothetical protein